MTALYVTHDQEEALAISDRVVVMREGRIEQAAAPADLYLRPASRYVAEFVGQATLIEAEVVQGVPQALGLAWPVADPGANPWAEPCADGPWLMVLRPEELAPDPAGALAGKVAWVRYLGAVLRVGLVLPCGTGLMADLPARAARPALGAMLAGIVGGLLVTITCINLGMGGPTSINAFMMIMIGGAGVISGAIMGGFILGMMESVGLTLLASSGEITYLAIFASLMVFLAVRPQGLMGKPWG